MALAMQINSSDRIVRGDTVQNFKDSNAQSLSTKTKKGEQLVFMMRAFKKTFDLLGDDIVDLSTENYALKNKID